MKRMILGCLVLELLVIGAVVTVFRLIEARVTAGAVAGSIFLALGFYILRLGLVNSSFRRSKTFAFGCVHLFVSATPLFVTRLLNHATTFEQVSILGLPGPLFHRVSTSIYMMLLLATVYDWVVAVRAERAQSSSLRN